MRAGEMRGHEMMASGCVAGVASSPPHRAAPVVRYRLALHRPVIALNESSSEHLASRSTPICQTIALTRCPHRH